MTTHIPPLPSGYVRAKQAAVPFAEVQGLAQSFAAGIVAVWDAVAGPFHTVVSELRRHRERRRMMVELTSLSDHALKDIGLNRTGLRSAVIDIERGMDPRGR